MQFLKFLRNLKTHQMVDTNDKRRIWKIKTYTIIQIEKSIGKKQR